MGKQPARADTCQMHTGNGRCGAPSTAQAAVGSTHRTETLESCGVNTHSFRKCGDVNSENVNDLWILATDSISYKNNV